jgi:hypothetical protein
MGTHHVHRRCADEVPTDMLTVGKLGASDERSFLRSEI